MKRDGGELDFEVLQLTKKGFDYLKYDLGELLEMRYAAQSVAHDYWATAFQLGEFINGTTEEVELLTEQEILCTDDSLLPRWRPKSREHIPDGLTCIRHGETESVIAIEVELNLKPLLRYDKIGHFFDAALSKVDVVFWLCANRKLAQKISDRLYHAKLRNFDIHNFITTSDFRAHGWAAPVLAGSQRGSSIKEVYLSKGYHKATTPLPHNYHSGTKLILFPSLRSPVRPRS